MKQFLFMLIMLMFNTMNMLAQSQVVYYKTDGKKAYYKVVMEGKENKYYKESLSNGKVSTEFKYPGNKISKEKYDAVQSEEKVLTDVGLSYEEKLAKQQMTGDEKQKIDLKLSNDKELYKYKAGENLCKSAKLQYAAIGCGVVSVAGWVLSCTAFKDNSLTKLKKSGSSKSGYSYSLNTVEDTNKSKRTVCYVTSGVFAVAGIICEICAIDYKMKSGKMLKLSSKANEVSLSYNF